MKSSNSHGSYWLIFSSYYPRYRCHFALDWWVAATSHGIQLLKLSHIVVQYLHYFFGHLQFAFYECSLAVWRAGFAADVAGLTRGFWLCRWNRLRWAIQPCFRHLSCRRLFARCQVFRAILILRLTIALQCLVWLIVPCEKWPHWLPSKQQSDYAFYSQLRRDCFHSQAIAIDSAALVNPDYHVAMSL